jgi:hypothetical protein
MKCKRWLPYCDGVGFYGVDYLAIPFEMMGCGIDKVVFEIIVYGFCLAPLSYF